MSERKRKLLITGAAGVIGRSLLEGLEAKETYDIVAADLLEDENAGIVAMDVTDGERVKELMQGVHTVLHIAWAKDEEDFLGKVLPINVTGAYNVYEAARLNGVQRVIFASSNHATGFYPTGEDIEVDDPYRPDSFYGLSKCYIELLGRYYVDKYNLSSFNIRIGNFSGDTYPHSERSAHIWISPRDMVQLAECCMGLQRIQTIIMILAIWRRKLDTVLRMMQPSCGKRQSLGAYPINRMRQPIRAEAMWRKNRKMQLSERKLHRKHTLILGFFLRKRESKILGITAIGRLLCHRRVSVNICACVL